MAWYPRAIQKPAEKMLTSGRRARRDGIILHIAASEATSLYGWWQQYPRNGGNGSHFYVRRDGSVEQYADTDLVVWTSQKGSLRTVGVETQGMAEGPWTSQQVETLADLTAWLWQVEEHVWPLTPMTSSSGRGVGWHSQGLPRVKGSSVSSTGGEVWASDPYKTCPGAQRVAQIPQILARAIDLTHATPTTPSEEDDMTPTQAQQLADTAGAVGLIRDRLQVPGQPYGYPAHTAYQLDVVVAQLAALTSTIGLLAQGSGLDAATIKAAAEAGADAALAKLADRLKG